MNYYIDEDKCKELGLTVPELLVLLLVKSTGDITGLFKQMTAREMLHREELFGTFMVTQAWDEKASNAILNADPKIPEATRIEKLAEELMEVFPKGKQPGGKYYFRGNKKDVSLKLKKFFKLYGDTFTDEQIVNAAKSYVNSFNGNYKTMRLLKYFIWKDITKVDSEGKPYIEEVSDLADYISNGDSDLTHDTDWTANLV